MLESAAISTCHSVTHLGKIWPDLPVMPRLLSCLFLLGLLLHTKTYAQTMLPVLSGDDLGWLGERIYSNECNRHPQCLTSWNEGEDFPSLGIGHFIWYRQDQQEVFQETFPALLTFLGNHGAELPFWIAANDFEQPWANRESFLAAQAEAELVELRSFLQETMSLQTAFIVARFDTALASLLAAAPESQREILQRKINSLTSQNARLGLYALIDYVHFKGDGTKPGERYAEQGWGLLQVLETMPEHSETPLQDFVSSASAVLARRVANAPPERNEQRWLAGWQNRLNTYLPGN